MLRTFQRYQTHATWATVGFLLFGEKRELLDYLPARRPHYARPELDPYAGLEAIGENERADPYHFGISLVRQILDCEGMELGSHTFSHYYCLEDGQTLDTFRHDMEASIAATVRLTRRPVSLVFPRNQYAPPYLKACADLGFTSVRTNEASSLYRSSPHGSASLFTRGARLADAYLNISGENAFVPDVESGVLKIPSSRFLRPFKPRFSAFEPQKVARIKNSMTVAASRNQFFHLWWHPHNFGSNLEENMAGLEEILRHHLALRDKYGVRSLTMAEAAETLGTFA